MADYVDQILERMVPDLTDLVARGLFTEAEARSIAQKRRAHEYLFAKRAADPADFALALEFEASLESLRALRRARVAPTSRAAASDHSIVRRSHFIFDRACKRFRQDVAWWLQWADFALRSNSAKAAGRIFGAALTLHPRCVELWLQAAAFEFDRQGNVGAARALLLRGLRANGASLPLWLAYFRMECSYVQKVRGRRLLAAGGEGAAAAAGAAGAEDGAGGYEPELEGGGGGGEAAPAPLPGTAALEGGDAAAEAAFFSGAVPRIVFDQAMLALRPPAAAAYAAFLDAADSYGDALAGAAVEALGRGGAGGSGTDAGAAAAAAARGVAALGARASAPAFPELSAHIVGALAAALPGDAAAWGVLATRGLSGLASAARERRAAMRAAAAGAARGKAPVAHAARADEALFVVDTAGGGAGGEGDAEGKEEEEEEEEEDEEEEGGEGAGEESEGEEGGEGGGEDPFEDPLSTPLPPAALSSFAAWTAALTSGAVDTAVVRGLLPSLLRGALGAPPAVPRLLRPFPAPLWAAAAAGAPAAGEGASPRKRARAPQPPPPAPAPPAAAAFVPGAPPEPLPPHEADAPLLEWASELGARAGGLFSSAAAAAPGGGGAPFAAARAAALRALLALPLTQSAGNSRRCLALLGELEECAAGAALPAAGGGEGGEAAALAPALALHLLRVQAALRRGDVAAAVAAAGAAAAPFAARGVPQAALAAARLAALLQAAAREPWAAAAGGGGGGGAPPPPFSAPLGAPLPAGFSVAAAAPVAPAGGAERAVALLRAALAGDGCPRGARARAHGRGAIWAALIHGAAARGGRAAAAAALGEALADGLLPEVEAAPRLAFIAAALAPRGGGGAGAPPLRGGELAPALGPAAPPRVHALAARALVDAVAAGALRAAEARAVLDLSVATPAGGGCGAVWLSFLRLEAAQPLLPPPDVKARALRALAGQEAAAFVEAAALLAAGRG
jgi:hypothetical protein